METMEFLDMEMRDPLSSKNKLWYQVVSLTDDGNVSTPTDKDLSTIEDLFTNSFDEYMAPQEEEEEERKALVTRIDALNNLIANFEVPQNSTSGTSGQEGKTTTEGSKEDKSKAYSTATPAVASPEGKRQRRPNPRFFDGNGESSGRADRNGKHGSDTNVDERTDRGPSAEVLKTASGRQGQSAQDVATHGEVELLDQDDFALITTPSGLQAFDSPFGWDPGSLGTPPGGFGGPGPAEVSVGGDIGREWASGSHPPSNFVNVGDINGGGEVMQQSVTTKNSGKGSGGANNNNTQGRKTASVKKSTDSGYYERGANTGVGQGQAATSAQSGGSSRSGGEPAPPRGVPGVHTQRQPGKRQSKPNPRFFGEDCIDGEPEKQTSGDGEGSGGGGSAQSEGAMQRTSAGGGSAGARAAAARARSVAAGRKHSMMMLNNAQGLHYQQGVGTQSSKRTREVSEGSRQMSGNAGYGGDGYSQKQHVSSGGQIGGHQHQHMQKKSRSMTTMVHQADVNTQRRDYIGDDEDEDDDDEGYSDGDEDISSPSKPSRKASSKSVSEQQGRRSKHHNPWALEEAEALVEGVARCGGGKWADIKKLGFAAIDSRSAVDLKDKWRNLLRIAMLPNPPVPKSGGDKKREIPQSLLMRVRELAARAAKNRPPDGRSNRGRDWN